MTREERARYIKQYEKYAAQSAKEARLIVGACVVIVIGLIVTLIKMTIWRT